MWSLIQIFKTQGQKDQAARCVEILRWHLEKGWDRELGGIFLSIDLAGQEPYWPFAEYKPWWPAVEAMYALLLAYAETHQPWILPWYERVHNYAFTHYPVRPQGEWRNRLDREGKPIETVIALPVKDPFHLPRALIMAGEVLEQLSEETTLLNLILPE
jgi:N-acylglucosamine 2-epimerase